MNGGAAFVDIFVDCGQDDVRVIQTIPVNVVQRNLCVAQARGTAVTKGRFLANITVLAGAHKRNFTIMILLFFLCFSVVLLLKKKVYNETGENKIRKIVSDVLSFVDLLKEKGRDRVKVSHYCGREDLRRGHFFGPAVRSPSADSFSSLKEKRDLQDGTWKYEIKEGEAFLIRPGRVTYYRAGSGGTVELRVDCILR